MVTTEPAVSSARLLDLNYILATCRACSTKILFCRVLLKHLFSHPASRAFLCLLEWGGEMEALPESRQTFAEAAAAQTFGPLNLVPSRQTGFFECERPFFDKPMVITDPAETTCSTKILLDLCRVFLQYAKIEQARERLCRISWDKLTLQTQLTEDDRVIT